MKYGFDYHGVLDSHARVYGPLTQALVDAGHEVHIITGAMWSEELEKSLKDNNIVWTHWFSIVEYHTKKGDTPIVWQNGKPWLHKETWDRTKAVYCESHKIDMMFDDSPVYGSYFGENTLYLLQRDPNNLESWMILAGRI